jgi:hypothetical protein
MIFMLRIAPFVAASFSFITKKNRDDNSKNISFVLTTFACNNFEWLKLLLAKRFSQS